MGNKTKKKHSILGIIAAIFSVLFVLVTIGSFIPDTDTSGQAVSGTTGTNDVTTNDESIDVKEETKTEEPVEDKPEEQIEDAADEVQEESIEESDGNFVVDDSKERNQEYYDKYYMLGTPLSFQQNGEPFTATITEAGLMELSSGIDRGILVYMIVEIENNGENPITFYNNDFSLYVDNYQYNNDPITMDNETVMQTNITVNPGRKGIFTYRSLLPAEYKDTDSIETLEIGMGSTSIYIKDNYQYMYAD